MNAQTKESQDAMSPTMALNILKEGNLRFQQNLKSERDLLKQVQQTGTGQFPHSVVLSCIDSRLSAELIFDQGIGDIFSARVAGNFVNEDILGSMEFGCKLAGSKLILVVGHSACGAIKGACDDAKLGNLTTMLEKLKPAVDATIEPSENRNSKNIDFVNTVARKNVELTIANIKMQSPVLMEMLNNGEIDIKGAFYHVDSGKVEFFD